jgi:hypothetical protein
MSKLERRELISETINWLDCNDPRPYYRQSVPVEPGPAQSFLNRPDYLQWKKGTSFMYRLYYEDQYGARHILLVLVLALMMGS